MAKALRKAEVETARAETLADFWREANIVDVPAWGHSINLARTPFRHQVADLNHLAQHVRSGLWNEPGVGKTFPSQAHVLWLVSQGNKAICTMPPVLVEQFRDSFHASFPGVFVYVSIAAFSGAIDKRNQMIEEWNRSGWPDVLIMSYDMFAGKSETEISSLVRKRQKAAEARAKVLEAYASGGWQAVAGLYPNKANTKDGAEIACERWVRELKKKDAELQEPVEKLSPADEAGVSLWLKKGYNHLLIDEATAVKTPGSDIHRAAAKFAGKDGPESNGLVLMTGSPVENNITDLYGLIKLITPNRYGSYRAFERIHCVMTYGRFPKLVGFQNEDYAYQSLYLQGRRVLKKDVSDLPPKLVTEIPVDLAKPHLDLYKKLVRERVLEIGEEIIDATTASSLYQKMQRLLLCPENFAENWTTKNTLVDSLDELVHSLGGRKLLMYVWFNDSIDKLAEHFKKLNPAQLNGSITGKDRELQKMKFIEDNSCRLMLANVRSGGVGIDGWQQVCSHVAFAEICPIPGAFEQAVGRLHRTGQQAEMINVYMFTPLQTVAVKLRNDLVKKEQTANTAVRDAKTLLFDLMGQDGLQGELE